MPRHAENILHAVVAHENFGSSGAAREQIDLDARPGRLDFLDQRRDQQGIAEAVAEAADQYAKHAGRRQGLHLRGRGAAVARDELHATLRKKAAQ
ncbi:MAG: hypothetical protein ACREPT_01265 [Rudaea sp.]